MAPTYKEVTAKLKVANEEIAGLKKKNREKNKEINELKALLKAFQAQKKGAQRAPSTSSAPESPEVTSESSKPRGRIRMNGWSVIVENRDKVKSCVMDFDGSKGNEEIVVPIQEKVMQIVESQVRKAMTLTNTKILNEETEQYDLMNVIRGMDDYSNSQFAFDLPKELPVLPGDPEFYENL